MGFRVAPPGRLETFGDGEAKEPWGAPRDIWAPRHRDTWGFWAYIWVPCLCVFLIVILVALDRVLLAKRPGKLCVAQWPGQTFLLLVGLSPLLCMLFFIEVCHDTLLAMLFMHWGCMLLLPMLYLMLFTRDRTLHIVYSDMLVQEFNTGPGMRLILGSILGVGVLIVLCGGASLMSCQLSEAVLDLRHPLCIGSLTKHSRLYGLGYSLPFLISTSVYFSLINPTFEELFWRVFLHREMGKTLFPDTLDTEEEPPAAQLCNETGRWVVSLFYASYHCVVVRFLVANSRPWWVGLIFVVGTLGTMSVLGRILVWARESPSLGIMGAWSMHVLVDIAVCLLFGASVFGYL